MNIFFKILSVAVIFSCGLLPYHYAQTQCLSANDDLSKAADTDLLKIQNFAVELFKMVVPKNPPRNFVFSPYSVWSVLVLAYFGSEGKTEKQFQKVLGISDKISTLRQWRQLEYMNGRRAETSVNNTFVLFTQAYFDKSVCLRFCMQDILRNELQQLDFMDDPQGAANEINQLVSETTRGHITQLVSLTDVVSAHFVLVNVAFFNGYWAKTFDPNNTRNQPFETLDGHITNIPMMEQFGKFFYGFDDDIRVEVIELPYVGNMSMYIFLPYHNSRKDFQAVINSLTSANIKKILENMHEVKTRVILPKFSLATTIEDQLMEALFRMGLTDVFVLGKANFTGFTNHFNLYLDRSVHKAFINVNEEGTEAGAATAFIVNKNVASIFMCNKPFIFTVRDKDTQNLLFLGTFTNPSSIQTQSSNRPF